MHTTNQREKLLARVRRLRGQIEGIERALELAGARGAMAGLMAEVVEDHIGSHLVDAARYPDALNRDAAQELLEVVRAYLK